MTAKLTSAYLGVIIACLIAIILTLAIVPRLEAAPPDVPACEAINTADVITIYRCEPNEGAPYLLNSYGFMVVED